MKRIEFIIGAMIGFFVGLIFALLLLSSDTHHQERIDKCISLGGNEWNADRIQSCRKVEIIDIK